MHARDLSTWSFNTKQVTTFKYIYLILFSMYPSLNHRTMRTHWNSWLIIQTLPSYLLSKCLPKQPALSVTNMKSIVTPPREGKGLLSDASVAAFGQAPSDAVLFFHSALLSWFTFQVYRAVVFKQYAMAPQNLNFHQILHTQKKIIFAATEYTYCYWDAKIHPAKSNSKPATKTVCFLKHVNSFFHEHIRHQGKGTKQLSLNLDIA